MQLNRLRSGQLISFIGCQSLVKKNCSMLFDVLRLYSALGDELPGTQWTPFFPSSKVALKSGTFDYFDPRFVAWFL